MDVLFKSIDVRELLSTTDLDNESPLSAPDLRLLIDRLDSHSQHIKSKVREYVVSHRSHFSQLLSLSSAAASQSIAISSELDSLISILSSDQPIDAEIRDVLSAIKSTIQELEAKRAQARVVKVIVGLSERLESARSMVSDARFVEAARTVMELNSSLRIGKNDEEDREKEIAVYAMLRKEWSDCFEMIQEVLVKYVGNAVRFDTESNTFRVLYCSGAGGVDGIKLHTAIEAMDVLGILDYGLARVADLFIKYAVSPAASRPSISFIEEIDETDGERSEAVLKIITSSDDQAQNLDGETLFSRMIDVVNFAYKSLCFKNGPWMRHFGKLTWPRMSELIITNFLSKVVPDDASKLSDFQRIISMSTEFEAALKDMMFISSDKIDERLSSFADNVEVHFAMRKKIEILATARKSILQCDFSLPRVFSSHGRNSAVDEGADNAADLIFLSQKCVVSEAASQLMKLVHQTLKLYELPAFKIVATFTDRTAVKDVCLSSPRVALEFYHAARDALLLYEAIVPVKLERQLDSINQVAILVHNDCLYLSQEILGLAFEYRSNFPVSVKEHAVFVDVAPKLYLLAETVLQRHIQRVIFSLREAVDGADGFQNTHQIQQFESAKFSIDQVIFSLEKVRLLWEPLLPPSTYKRSMCMLLETVFSRISHEILVLDDIAAEETLQLQQLIHLMLENLSPLLESLSAIKTSRSSEDYNAGSLELEIPSLAKIQKLSEMLDMPLKSITDAWESSELFSCGFVLSEVVDFIKAIFTDSPLRRDCLRRIQSTTY